MMSTLFTCPVTAQPYVKQNADILSHVNWVYLDVFGLGCIGWTKCHSGLCACKKPGRIHWKLLECTALCSAITVYIHRRVNFRCGREVNNLKYIEIMLVFAKSAIVQTYPLHIQSFSHMYRT